MSKAEAIHAHSRAAHLLIAKGEIDEGLAELRNAIALADDEQAPASPNQRAWLYNQLGNVLDKLGRADDAIEAFRRAARCAMQAPAAPGMPSATGPTGPVGMTGTTGTTGT